MAPLVSPAIALWTIPLTPPRSLDRLAARILQPDEYERARRFVFAPDRERFILSHLALRVILTQYTGAPPEQIRFTYTAYGKPMIAPPLRAPMASFNISHSHELALCVIASTETIGVDIERVRPMEYGSIGATAFSADEQAALRNTATTDQQATFFRIWTRKEAYIKAWGMGVSYGLKRFTVDTDDHSPGIRHDTTHPTGTAHWSIIHLEPAPGYIGAIAAPQPNAQIRQHAFSWDTVSRYEALGNQ
jgi:4'-phosphopantetheinyl transferase